MSDPKPPEFKSIPEVVPTGLESNELYKTRLDIAGNLRKLDRDAMTFLQDSLGDSFTSARFSQLVMDKNVLPDDQVERFQEALSPQLNELQYGIAGLNGQDLWRKKQDIVRKIASIIKNQFNLIKE